ncbi:hypothetical protein [Vibrio quintilis]|uniref:SMODS and SLOG-associating 2TM effector domain-containing protein n=1 Tax=Vibrio quintilis TaxID=1117707 RepID=A0A1M7YZ64_9VIBR|nr:hypothetical protein [Vibrio quintilis]SHO57863.1 hypothetical protein VQ7734_03633 [Vibrio quintilis]
MTETNFTNAPNPHQNQKADFSIFDVHYSARMEQYNAIFYRRFDNLLTIVQLILGSSIAFQLSNNMVTGFLMVAISMFVFTIKPAQVSAKSDIQYHCYLPLITSQLSEEELHTRFLEIQKRDSNVILSLSNIAFIRAGLEKELDVSQEKLSVKEWVLARFIGETLKMKNNE